MAVKKQNTASHAEQIDEKCGYWRTHVISWPCVLGMHSTGMQTEWKNHWTVHKDVWVTYFCSGMAKTSRTNISVVLRYGRTCAKMHRATLWTGKQENRATLQSFKSLPGWSSIQTGRTRISWRLVRSLHTHCLEMLILGTYWTTWHLVVSQQACEISHKMDQSLWQMISKADFQYSSHECRQYCHVGNTAQHCRLGLFQDADIPRRSWRLKIDFGWNPVHLWQSYVCSHKLHV